LPCLDICSFELIENLKEGGDRLLVNFEVSLRHV
jgi:hypothetical protein